MDRPPLVSGSVGCDDPVYALIFGHAFSSSHPNAEYPGHQFFGSASLNSSIAA